MELISLILNAILGGSLIVTLVTLRATRLKATADAKGSELDNVQEAITIWREMAETLKSELEASRKKYEETTEQMHKEVESLRRAVTRLTYVNNKMVKLLDKITPDNLETMVEQIKQLHNEN